VYVDPLTGEELMEPMWTLETASAKVKVLDLTLYI
jgi:hypothetical protein